MEAVFNNYARLVIECQVDIDDDGTVLATRGDGMTCTKSDTGEYTLVFKAGGGLKLVKVMQARADMMDRNGAATARCDVTAITQDSNTDDMSLVVETNDGSAAADEDTAAFTMNVKAVLQTANMTNPL
jgi:hypothetical protein